MSDTPFPTVPSDRRRHRRDRDRPYTRANEREPGSGTGFARSASRAGLTQDGLAEGRFSKEYISQIERGKTRPTESTIEWLAERLGVDPAFLSHGVSTEERTKVETLLARAEAQSEAHRYEEAIESFREARPAVEAHGLAGSRAPPALGRGLGAPGARRDQDRDPAAPPGARPRRRAAVLRRRPRGRSLPPRGVPLQALEHRDRGRAVRRGARSRRAAPGLPCDLLRAEILNWRSRCHRRQRDYVAAHEDVERALDLAQDVGDRRAMANTYFMASADRAAAGPLDPVAELRAARQAAVPGAERRANTSAGSCCSSAVSPSSWETRTRPSST